MLCSESLIASSARFRSATSRLNALFHFKIKNRIQPETIIMPPAMGNMSFQSIKGASDRFDGSGCFPNVNGGEKKQRARNSDRQTVRTGTLPYILSDEVILIKSIIPFDISIISSHSSKRWVFRFSYPQYYREWGAVRIRCTLPSRKIT